MRIEDAAEILFELGSEDRLEILSELGKEQLKLSQIAIKLSSSIQEASRQCGRLEDAGLIEKHPDGRFGVTILGWISLSLLPAFALLGEEKEYFAAHDPSSMPNEFVQRLGELSDHKRIDHIDDALKFQQSVVKEAENFVWFLSDQPVGHSLRETHSHFSSNVNLRLILPKSIDTESFRAAKNSMGNRLEIGLVSDVRLVLAMNEKAAAFGLPTLDGRPDYSRGFVGNSPAFRGWCHDLFDYYWTSAEKVYPVL